MNQDDTKEKSLWGDLEALESVPTPHTHLKEQGEILTRSTKWVLRGRVSREVSPEGTFTCGLDVVAPKLNEYHHTILEITHGLQPYPLTVYDHANNKTYQCKDEPAFLGCLKAVLSSTSVRNVLASLISQSKA